jgi:hypothetical protein
MPAGGGDIVALENEELLRSLIETLGARGTGNVAGFSKVGIYWRCPACGRSKAEIARLDKNGNLLCAIVSHHDHFHDFEPGLEGAGAGAAYVVLARFQPTLICNDCNVVDAAAKKMVGAPGYFSFAPYEIAYFINVARNEGHKVDLAKAHTAYAAAQPGVGLLEEMLANARAGGDRGPEHISEPVNRVLAAARARMKPGGE